MITVVCSIINYKLFNKCLGESLSKQTVPFHFIATPPYLGLPESYNKTIQNPPTKYIMFIGQDITLLGGDWLEKAEQYCDNIPNLGVAGVAGKNEGNRYEGYIVVRHREDKDEVEYHGNKLVGRIWGKPFTEPREALIIALDIKRPRPVPSV